MDKGLFKFVLCITMNFLIYVPSCSRIASVWGLASNSFLEHHNSYLFGLHTQQVSQLNQVFCATYSLTDSECF